MKHKRLDPLIEGYLAYLTDVRRQRPLTITDIRCTLRRVSAAMSKQYPDTALWQLDLSHYLKWIEQERQCGRSPSCLNKYVSHVRSFLDYAWRSGRSDRNVLDGFSLQDSKRRDAPQFLSVEEARRLIQCAPKDTFIERRDRIMLLLLYGCGLRTKELCDLNISDVNRERGELLVRKGKGDVQRVVPIPQRVQIELWAYLLDRGGMRGPLLRTEHNKKRVASKDVCQAVREAVERAGIDRKVTPRTLRHSYATHLMDRGVDLAVISSLMGHRSPTETGVYLHVLKDRPKQAVDKLLTNDKKGAEQ